MLDGLPLAIELAARRLGSLSAPELARSLEQRVELLSAGDRTAPPRQRTLEAAIRWSYELLDEREQLLLLRLAAFRGSFTAEAAEAVAVGDGLDRAVVLPLLLQLVDHSLVAAEPGEPSGATGCWRRRGHSSPCSPRNEASWTAPAAATAIITSPAASRSPPAWSGRSCRNGCRSRTPSTRTCSPRCAGRSPKETEMGAAARLGTHLLLVPDQPPRGNAAARAGTRARAAVEPLAGARARRARLAGGGRSLRRRRRPRPGCGRVRACRIGVSRAGAARARERTARAARGRARPS